MASTTPKKKTKKPKLEPMKLEQYDEDQKSVITVGLEPDSQAIQGIIIEPEPDPGIDGTTLSHSDVFSAPWASNNAGVTQYATNQMPGQYQVAHPGVGQFVQNHPGGGQLQAGQYITNNIPGMNQVQTGNMGMNQNLGINQAGNLMMNQLVSAGQQMIGQPQAPVGQYMQENVFQQETPGGITNSPWAQSGQVAGVGQQPQVMVQGQPSNNPNNPFGAPGVTNFAAAISEIARMVATVPGAEPPQWTPNTSGAPWISPSSSSGQPPTATQTFLAPVASNTTGNANPVMGNISVTINHTFSGYPDPDKQNDWKRKESTSFVVGAIQNTGAKSSSMEKRHKPKSRNPKVQNPNPSEDKGQKSKSVEGKSKSKLSHKPKSKEKRQAKSSITSIKKGKKITMITVMDSDDDDDDIIILD